MKKVILLAGLIVCTSNLYGQTCTPPNYCADQSTAVKAYPASAVPTPPTLNSYYVDSIFNRPIWRWTDGTTTDGNRQRSQGIVWHVGNFAGAWNAFSNAFITQDDQAYSTVLKVNTSKPNAPVASLWSCTDATSGLCTNGQIKLPNSPIFANTSNYLIYYLSNDQKLSKADFAANYGNPATPPTVTSPWFDPFGAGHCAASLTANNGGGNPLTTSDDAYFWGFSVPTANKIIIWHGGDSNCTLLDMAGAGGTWTVSGVGQQGGGTGAITFVDENNNPAANPGTGCSLHSQWYDQVTNTVVAQIQGTDCSNYPSISSFHVNLTTLKGWACGGTTRYYCGSGHGIGMTVSAAGQSYETNFGTVSANTLKLWAVPLTLPDTVQAWDSNPPDATGHNYLANHSAAVWTTSFPIIAALYNQDSEENTSPPQSTLPTGFQIPYAEEIDVLTVPDITGSNAATYRFVHTYEADHDYNSGGAYNSAVGPALSPDKCWVAFPSNWYGNLGATGSRGTACTISGSCAYDVFAVYLCNAGYVAPPTNLVVTVTN